MADEKKNTSLSALPRTTTETAKLVQERKNFSFNTITPEIPFSAK